MSKKVKRGFFGYLMIFLGIALACLAVCVVVMIFNPGLQIFGISYFSEKEEFQVKEVDLYRNNEAVLDEEGKVKTVNIYDVDTNGNVTVLDYKTIEINSNVYDVEYYIHPETDAPGFENVTNILVKSDVNGFTKEGTRKLSASYKYFEDTKVLQINIETPIGFVNFSNASKIRVEIPSQTLFGNINIKANTQSGDITLGGVGTGATVLKAESINLTTTSGNITTTENFNLSNALLDSSIKTDSGNVNFTRPIICKNFNLTTKTGEMRFENEHFSVLGEFNFTAENSFLHLNNLTASKINFASVSGKIYAKTLTGAVDFTTETENCHLQVETINGPLIVGKLNEDKISTRTKVEISNCVSGICNIFTLGEVNIGEIKSATIIRGKDANITIKKVSGDLILDSENSKITLGKITDENGNFLTAGVENKINVNCTNNADVELYFKTVISGSTVTTKKGNIYADLSTSLSGSTITATGKKVVLNGEEKESPLTHNNNGTQAITLTSEETVEIKTA